MENLMTSTSNQIMTCNYPSRKQKDGAKNQSREVMIKKMSHLVMGEPT
jgi:hypothetical protein